jgi:hypothetical protein
VSVGSLLKADHIAEKTGSAGVSVGSLLKADHIAEKTGSHGVILDNNLTAPNVNAVTAMDSPSYLKSGVAQPGFYGQTIIDPQTDTKYLYNTGPSVYGLKISGTPVKVKSIKVGLRKENSPTGNAYVCVYSATGREVVATFDTAALTASMVATTFTLATPAQMQDGDIIGIEYTGGSGTNNLAIQAVIATTAIKYYGFFGIRGYSLEAGGVPANRASITDTVATIGFTIELIA